ncbi:MAG: nitroreductase family protein [Desulfobacterales bacterium]
MKLIVDETRCKKDGVCIDVCPNKVIEQAEDNGFPRLVPGLEVLCILCGHCIAVCPHGALSHSAIPREACTPIKEELVITEEQTTQLLRTRRSVRVYKDRSVEKETIEKLIEIASYAPTGGNRQLVRWIAVADKDKIQELSGLTIEWMRHKLEEKPYSFAYPSEFLQLVIAKWEKGEDPILRKAPALIVAKGPEIMATDPILALSYLELAAVSMGLGTCWAGLLRSALLEWAPAREVLGLKLDKPTFFYPIMLGYPKYPYPLLPKRNPPKIQWI